MRIKNIDTNNQVLVIAEIGNNHEGNYSLAEQMVGLAAEAGAHAVKFQTFKTEYYVSKKDEARYNRLKSFELSYNQFEQLSKLASKLGLLFISTPFDLDSAMFLENIVDAYKIASGDNNFFPLLKKVAESEKPMIVSGGLADVNELKTTFDFIQNTKKSKNLSDKNIALLHCTTNYPVLPENANLLAIQSLKNEFNCAIGFSDHTIGNEAAIMAVALGARIIEKHFTIDKNYSSFRDHQLSLNPVEFKELVEQIKLANTLLGKSEKKITDTEKEIHSLVRRSIVAKHDLKTNQTIEWDDITWIRPGSGLPPGEEEKIIGKKLKLNVIAGEPLLPENFV